MEYVKENNIIDLDDNQKQIELIQTIIKTKNDLTKAHENFEFAEDELVDFYVYQIKALQSKYDYLSRVVKKEQIGTLKK